MGGAEIRQGDAVVLDVDGVAVVESERAEEVLEAARERFKAVPELPDRFFRRLEQGV